MDWTVLSTPVVVAAVPIVVAFIKKWLPSWLIPPVAIVLGGLAEALAAWTLNRPVDPTVLAVAGVAGVGLRELVDQFKKAIPA
jgi:hypothetical protein